MRTQTHGGDVLGCIGARARWSLEGAERCGQTHVALITHHHTLVLSPRTLLLAALWKPSLEISNSIRAASASAGSAWVSRPPRAASDRVASAKRSGEIRIRVLALCWLRACVAARARPPSPWIAPHPGSVIIGECVVHPAVVYVCQHLPAACAARQRRQTEHETSSKSVVLQRAFFARTPCACLPAQRPIDLPLLPLGDGCGRRSSKRTRDTHPGLPAGIPTTCAVPSRKK